MKNMEQPQITVKYDSEVKKTSIYPITIHSGGKEIIGIEYLNGKYILHGKEHMDEGVQILFEGLCRKFQETFPEWPIKSQPPPKMVTARFSHP